ncbi:MAG: hypothetical protein LBR27_04765 [Bifidobacteriaceae bacterium]|nr:hypothetical protein [Bifidobacteriaceae bacterium]
MVTTLPRYTVTEVPALAQALAKARAAWPEVKSVSQLIVRLAQLGGETLDSSERQANEARDALIDASVGLFPYEGGLAALYQSRQDEWS